MLGVILLVWLMKNDNPEEKKTLAKSDPVLEAQQETERLPQQEIQRRVQADIDRMKQQHQFGGPRGNLGVNPAVNRPANPFQHLNDNASFLPSQVKLPVLPNLGSRFQTVGKNVKLYEVDFQSEHQNRVSKDPGSKMKLRVYIPEGTHRPNSLGCVLLPPAGTNLLTGSAIDEGDYHDEALPYAEAGYVVVHFSLDGALKNESSTELIKAYPQFKAAMAGMVNARNAMQFAEKKIPAVNPHQIFIAGHSSAGTLALLFASHDPTLKGCLAYAPDTDLKVSMRKVVNPSLEAILPGVRTFIEKSSPMEYANSMHVPVFLFHAKDDQVVRSSASDAYMAKLTTFGKQASFRKVESGGHYESMIKQGIPLGIKWLNQQSGKGKTEVASNNTGSNPSSRPRFPGNNPTIRPPIRPPFPNPGGTNPNLASNNAEAWKDVPSNLKRRIRPGQRIFFMQLLGYEGKFNAEIRFRQLRGQLRLRDPFGTHVDSKIKKQIVIIDAARSLNLETLKQSLGREGFQIGKTHVINP